MKVNEEELEEVEIVKYLGVMVNMQMRVWGRSES